MEQPQVLLNEKSYYHEDRLHMVTLSITCLLREARNGSTLMYGQISFLTEYLSFEFVLYLEQILLDPYP